MNKDRARTNGDLLPEQVVGSLILEVDQDEKRKKRTKGYDSMTPESPLVVNSDLPSPPPSTEVPCPLSDSPQPL